MVNKQLLKQATELLQSVSAEELEPIQINGTKYDDGSYGFTIDLTYPDKSNINGNSGISTVFIGGNQYELFDRRAIVGDKVVYYSAGKMDEVITEVTSVDVEGINVLPYFDGDGEDVVGIIHGYYRVAILKEVPSDEQNY